MELIRHRHTHNLTADQMRLRLFRPGKFIDRQKHLIAAVANLADNLLVRQRKRVKCAWEECHLVSLFDL